MYVWFHVAGHGRVRTQYLLTKSRQLGGIRHEHHGESVCGLPVCILDMETHPTNDQAETLTLSPFLHAKPPNTHSQVNGFSKGYAMTGWRLGYLAAPLHIIQMVNKLQGQITGCCSSVSQMAGIAALAMDDGFIREMVTEYRYRYWRREAVRVCMVDPTDAAARGYGNPFGSIMLEGILTQTASTLQSPTIFSFHSVPMLFRLARVALNQASASACARLVCRKRRDFVVGEYEKMPGVEVFTPDGAFYVLPKVSALFGKVAKGASGKTYHIKNCDDLVMYLLGTCPLWENG